MNKIFAAVLIAVWAAVGGGATALFSQTAQDRAALEYRIGALDMLEIKVFSKDGKEQINAPVRVSEQGKVALPMLGEVSVEGFTASELEKRLGQLLELKYFQNPQVSVFIRERLSKRVSVLGAVGKPGFVELIGQQTLLQIITSVGGLSKDAGKEIIVTHLLADGSNLPSRISIDRLMLDPKLNIVLEPGDTVFVQVDRPATIYISGQVKSPGALQVTTSHMPTLTRAIAQAGDFTDRARKSKVVVRRRDADGSEKVFTIDVTAIQKGSQKDFQLEENDIIFVPESWI